MIEQMNHIGQLWWSWMGPMFWQVSVLIVLIGAIDLLLRRWAWPQVRYALWLLVLVKLVLPPGLSLPTSVTSPFQPWMDSVINNPVSEHPQALTLTSPVVPDKNTPDPHGFIAPDVKLGGSSDPQVDLPPNQDVTKPMASSEPSIPVVWQVYALVTWLLGMWIFTGWLILRLRHLRRVNLRNQDQTVLPEWFAGLLAHSAERLKLRRIPKVVLTNSVITPAVFGLFRPVLLMPADRLAKLSRQDAEHILLHELAHIKRGDLLVHGFYILLQIVYWFNPLLWLVRRQMQHLRELCCDATVARILRERTSEYRDTLLETARELLAKPVEPGLGLLGLFEDSSRLLTRLRWLEKKTWRHHRLRIAIVCTIVALMSACVLPMAKSDKEGNAIEEDRAAKSLTLANKNKSKFVATLPNGVTVELVGVCEHPSKGKQWWRPDGNLLAKGPYERMLSKVHPSASEAAYEFCVFVKNSRELGYKCEIMGASSSAGGSTQPNEAGMHALAAKLAKEQQQTTVKIAVSAGDWKIRKRRLADKNIFAVYGAKEGFTWTPAVEDKKGNTIVTVSHTYKQDQVRVIAIDNKGNEITGQTSGGSFSETVTTRTVIPVSLTNIKEFQFQTRPYEWVEFKNVSLKPNSKTDVQIEVQGNIATEDIKTDNSIGRINLSVGTEGSVTAEHGDAIHGSDIKYSSLMYLGRVGKGQKFELVNDQVHYNKFAIPIIKVKVISKLYACVPIETTGWVALAGTDFAKAFEQKAEEQLPQHFQELKKDWRKEAVALAQLRDKYIHRLGNISPTEPNSKTDVQVETKNVEKINWVIEDYGQTRLLSNKGRPKVDWVSIMASVVKNNGYYLVPDNGLTLKELIKAAGYNKDKLDESYVTVSRETKQGSQRAFKLYSRNFETLLSGKESNIPLKHGDAIAGGYIELSPNAEEFWGRYSFSDVVELTVNDDGAKVDMFADLDTAKLITPPETLDNTDENAVLIWIKENGIDILGETADSVRGLVGFNIFATRVDNYFWDVDKFQITDRLLICMNEIILLSADNVLPVTYLINTSEHTMGVLQILGFAENPHGIKIRYKLLKKTDVPVEGNKTGETIARILAGPFQRTAMLKQRAESLGRLRKIGLASVMYADDHNGKYPDSLDKLKPYIQEDDVLDWAKDNVVYLGRGKSINADPQAVIAYDKALLKKENSRGTNVLYNDTHVAFEKTERLKQLGLIPKDKTNVQIEVKKPDVQVEGKKSKKENLQTAITDGDIDEVRKLIEEGADVNAKDEIGRTPLHFVKNKAVAELLIAKGADVNARTKDGSTLLHTMAWNGNKEVVELLLENGADVNARHNKGHTPLHFAVRTGKKEVVKLLLANGARVNAKDEWSYRPLHWAAKKGYRNIIKLLLANGADVSAEDKKGLTPLDYTSKANLHEVMDVPGLIDALDDEDLKVRATARNNLRNIGTPAIDALVKALKDEKLEVRLGVAKTLGMMGPKAKDAAGALVEVVLKGDDKRLRSYAGWSLIRIDVSPFPNIMVLLKDEDTLVRRFIVEKLGYIGPEAVALLIQVLKDEDSLVRNYACWGLGNIGPEAKDAIGVLTLATQDDDKGVRYQAVEALRKIKPDGQVEGEELSERTKRVLAKRIDPNNVRNLVFRPARLKALGDNKIEAILNGRQTEGKLEFRVAPDTEEMTETMVKDYLGDLAENGPLAGRRRGDEFAWFEVRKGTTFYHLITGEYQGRKYLLLHNKEPLVMLPGHGWGLQKIYADTDALDRPSIAFKLDKKGLALFSALTERNINRYLAMLIDGKVYSVPMIKLKSRGRGAIVGKFTKEEVSNLIKALKIGMPAVELRANEFPGFAEVIERVIYGAVSADSAIDFDTGELYPAPEHIPDMNALQDWLHSNGIDALGMISSPTKGLSGFDMIVIPAKQKQWDISPELLRLNLSMGDPGTPAVMTGKGELPATYMFKTREGGIGILQITGFTDEPRGVKIRYKMASISNHNKTPQVPSSAKPGDKTIQRVWLRDDFDDKEIHDSVDMFDFAAGKIIPIRINTKRLTKKEIDDRLFTKIMTTGLGDIFLDKYFPDHKRQLLIIIQAGRHIELDIDSLEKAGQLGIETLVAHLRAEDDAKDDEWFRIPGLREDYLDDNKTGIILTGSGTVALIQFGKYDESAGKRELKYIILGRVDMSNLPEPKLITQEKLHGLSSVRRQADVSVEDKETREKVSSVIGADLPKSVTALKSYWKSFVDVDIGLIRFDIPLPDLKILLEKSVILPDFSELKKDPLIKKHMKDYQYQNVKWWKPDELKNAVYAEWSKTEKASQDTNSPLVYKNLQISVSAHSTKIADGEPSQNQIMRIYIKAHRETFVPLSPNSDGQVEVIENKKGGSGNHPTVANQRERLEDFLGIRFTEYRDINFYDAGMLGIGDYTTLISFEVPKDKLPVLLEQSPKLPIYNEFRVNTQSMTFMGQVVKDIDWWKPAELKNPVTAIKSWCAHHEGDKCALYAYASVAFAETESGWVRVYICCQAEAWPSVEFFLRPPEKSPEQADEVLEPSKNPEVN